MLTDNITNLMLGRVPTNTYCFLKSYIQFLFSAPPTTTNYAVEFPAFGEIAGVSTPGVQWMSLTLGKPPS